jgi:hypothetical protein
LLKFALDNSEAIPGTEECALVLSFFFQGSGHELQRTPLGLYRSLLYQVLRQVPDVLPDLLEAFEQKLREKGEPGEKWQWERDELQRFFESSIPKVLKSHRVWLFVDALDECGEANAAELVEWFKSSLWGLPAVGFKRFCICVSSRPLAIPRLEGVFQISLEEENREDISTYVQSRLSTLPVWTVSTIPALIAARAEGVFMWARLVVKQVLDLKNEGEGAMEAIIRSNHMTL